MAMIVILSAKASPGATTAVAAATRTWPASVLAVGADPSGDDLLTGWLGGWLMNGWIRPERGLLGFATATRHAEHVTADDLRPFIQAIPTTTHARIVTGLLEPGQASSVGPAGWGRLAHALVDLSRRGAHQVDVLVDGGRFGPATAWPLLHAADLVLVAVRPERRAVLAARPLARLLASRMVSGRLGLAVTTASAQDAREVANVLGLPVGLRTPDDPRSARWFSDGSGGVAPPGRSKLLQVVRGEAQRLHDALNMPHPASVRPLAGVS
ncbi:cellulose biosynthesis protein BcsQ [Actinocrispum wychmicini]|uniref:Cellulose biosynthesis protein BcsQ n=1 Tax=Actinocrispum wychmicini TaxID=1213861 RepID=A0A4V2S4V6_9PSEU|nr:cellulose biosynthesis protein BcsQ [Actinocrispum wychmicini]